MALIGWSLSACGTENAAVREPATPSGTTAAATPEASVAPPATTASPAPAPAPGAPAATAPTGGADTPAQDGGAAAVPTVVPGGDEAGNRVPVSFTVSAAGATPGTITVPPFLGILLLATSGDGATHSITVRAPAPATLTVPATGTASRVLDGLPAGSYAVDVDGELAVATLRVADEAVGP